MLLIDLDIGMGNIDILMGNSSSATIIDVLTDRKPLLQSLSVGPKGLRYISGNRPGCDVSTGSEKMDVFANELSHALSQFDYVLFDMGAGLSKDQLPLFYQQKIF